MEISDLPTLNAGLNGAAALLLSCGLVFIKRGEEGRHKACMLAAAACSALFLVSYLTYHAKIGSKHYEGTGTIRTVYFVILISHTVLAVVNVPLVVMTFLHAFKDRREKHRRLARWTFPVWLYVSVTGIVVYWMLYRSG